MKKTKKELMEFQKVLTQKMLDLATSGFGLVAALAWNDVIKDLIDIYIKPFFGEASGIISRLIYAIIVTILAVAVTYNLSKLTKSKK